MKFDLSNVVDSFVANIEIIRSPSTEYFDFKHVSSTNRKEALEMPERPKR